MSGAQMSGAQMSGAQMSGAQMLIPLARKRLARKCPARKPNHWFTKTTISTFIAKKNFGKASIQHSHAGDNSNLYEITRPEMVYFLKRELQCSLGSVPMPITMAILVDQYRQDTGDDLQEIALRLGYPTPEAMLQSEEFSDVVGCDYTEAALGSNATRDEKTLCYRVVPNNRTQHLIDAIVQSKEEREIQHKYRELNRNTLMHNASLNSKLLEGKERILIALSCLTEKGAINDGFVKLIELQRKYREIYGVLLDNEELRKYFSQSHIKKVFEYCMPDDIDIRTRVDRSGSLFLRLKRPLEEILADLEKIRQLHHDKKPQQETIANGNNRESKPSSSGVVPLHIKKMTIGNVKMDFWIWLPDKSYYRNQDEIRTTKEQKKKLWPKHLHRICDIGSIEDLRLNQARIKREHDTSHAVEYNYCVEGVKPCWDEAARMGGILYADVSLASDPEPLDALLNKWGCLAESLFNGDITNVKCITIRLRVGSHKLFLWTKEGLTHKALARICRKCSEITNLCEQEIKLVWDVYPIV